MSKHFEAEFSGEGYRVTITALGAEEMPASNAAVLFRAAPALLAAAEFSLSVHRAQGLYDLSERMAAEKLVAAISLVKGEAK